MSRDTPARPPLGSRAVPLPYFTAFILILAGTMATLLAHARQSGCWDFFSQPNLLALLGCLQDSTNEVGATCCLTPPNPSPHSHLSSSGRSGTWPQSCSSATSLHHSLRPSLQHCSSWPRMPSAAPACRRPKSEQCL